MKKSFVLLTLLVSMSATSAPMESHGNPEDDELCSKEVRSLECGDPEMNAEFMDCVTKNMEKLSKTCQGFHQDELDRTGH